MDIDWIDIWLVWQKGKMVPGANPDEWRKDGCDAWIYFDDYGDQRSEFGWEIDRVRPPIVGELHYLDNLRPLHWQNKVSRDDGGEQIIIVTAKGMRNRFVTAWIRKQ